MKKLLRKAKASSVKRWIKNNNFITFLSTKSLEKSFSDFPFGSKIIRKATKNKKLALEIAGFEQEWSICYRGLIWIVVISLIVLIIVFAPSHFWVQLHLQKIQGKEFTLADEIVTFGAILFAYRQWLASKKETSLDRFYDRLKLTNDKLNAWLPVRKLFPFFWKGEDVIAFKKAMYVDLELDNLEYAIVRYRLGYMDVEVAYRSLATFISRCDSEEFRKLALICVEDGIGYNEVLKKVVKNINTPEIWQKLHDIISPNKEPIP